MTELLVSQFFQEEEKNLELELLTPDICLDIPITSCEVNRPGLALAGYFEHFVGEDIQVLGRRESSYLLKLEPQTRHEIIKQLCSYNTPCIIATWGSAPSSDFIELAQSHSVPVFVSKLPSRTLTERITPYLESIFSPKTSVHGVLVDIYGMGVILLGKSSIGKSECALELIERGHRLVADDVVLITCTPKKELIGTYTELIRHHMEIRGIGIIDIRHLFGASAIRNEVEISLAVMLEFWDPDKEYERTGIVEKFHTILDIPLPLLTLPVRPGRNLATIIEVATLNEKLKRMGFHSGLEFNRELIKLMHDKKIHQKHRNGHRGHE